MKSAIKVRINPDGSTEISVNGVKGKKCTELTKGLEKALGVVTKQTMTNEYYQKDDKPLIRLGE